MTIDKQLIELRTTFDNGLIDKERFIEAVNIIFQDIIIKTTDEEKIAAFDWLAESIAESFYIDEINGSRKVQYINDDTAHYLYEEVLQAVCGDNIFRFVDKTYEST